VAVDAKPPTYDAKNENLGENLPAKVPPKPAQAVTPQASVPDKKPDPAATPAKPAAGGWMSDALAAVTGAAKGAPVDLAKAKDQLVSSLTHIKETAPTAIAEKLINGTVDQIGRTIESAKTSGASTSDFLGNMEQRWGNIALPVGLALMFFGGDMGKLAGGILAAAGGYNIYQRVQELGKPQAKNDLKAAAAIEATEKAKNPAFSIWSDEGFGKLAGLGFTPARLSVLRDLHAAILMGGSNTVHRAVIEGGAEELAKYTKDPRVIKAYYERLQAKMREMLPNLPQDAEKDYLGQESGWTDRTIGSVTGHPVEGPKYMKALQGAK
jgi:hypothetical protein